MTSLAGAASIARKMSKEPDPPFAPRQAYSDSQLDRAAHFRSDEQKLAAFHLDKPGRRLRGRGDNIVLKAHGEALDPLFLPAEARALGTPRETMFLGLCATRRVSASDSIRPWWRC